MTTKKITKTVNLFEAPTCEKCGSTDLYIVKKNNAFGYGTGCNQCDRNEK